MAFQKLEKKAFDKTKTSISVKKQKQKTLQQTGNKAPHPEKGHE